MKLSEWRKKHDLTMVQAAERLGLSQASISRIEAGEQWPDRKTVEKIMAATDGEVGPNDLIANGKDSPPSEPAQAVG